MSKIDATKSPRPGCESCLSANLCREFGWQHPAFIAHCAGISDDTPERQAARRDYWAAVKANREDGTPMPCKYHPKGGCKIHNPPEKNA